MQKIEGYELKEQLYTRGQTSVWRALDEDSGNRVILKFPRFGYPSRKELERLYHEFNIARRFDSEYVTKIFDLKKDDNRVFLVIEDFAAKSLRDVIRERKVLDLETFLRVGLGIVRGLEIIHSEGIIHKDIKPHNILINAQDSITKITDFGISSVLDTENPNPEEMRRLEGSLAYISPEQTGRMNRTLDYRSDFYSLGATFYEMITGKRLFVAEDPLEIIHGHIAMQPVPPREIDANIPKVISDLILKLLSKNAEDRYQSSMGLLGDLQKCLDQIQTNGKIDDFPLGSEDFAEKFQLPQKLYGRERQIRNLLDYFEKAAGGNCEALMVSGYSGIGKSSLVNEVNKPIVKSRGIFLSGKYDQFKRNIPYSALIEAFQKHLRQVLSESETSIEALKEKLLKALGANAQVIIDVIPEVETIIGPQPPVPQLDPSEAQNRFKAVLRNFVDVFARKEHPLALFIDDLQWADTPTLNFIFSLLTDIDTRYLLFIGAYRDNEVDESHPLILTIKELRDANRAPGDIHLTPLSDEDLEHFTADSMRTDVETSRPLAALVMQKTLGNPFFVGQFLKTLQMRGLIGFDRESRSWKADLDRIRDADITDNVVDLMSERMRHLSEETQKVLRMAACSGSRFTLHTMAIIDEATPEQVMGDLQPALTTGLVHPTGEADHGLFGEDEGQRENVVFRFLHDRVQQAAYALIEEGDRKQVHLKIGRLLLTNTPPEERDEAIFEITSQLNQGSELITDAAEQIELARLNFEAGIKAKESSAFEPAVRFLRGGIAILGEGAWEAEYDLMFGLHRDLAEALYVTGQFDESEAMLIMLLEKARDTLGKAQVQNLRLVQYTNRGRSQDGVKVGHEALALLGHPLPDVVEIDAETFTKEYADSITNLGSRKIADLQHSPVIEDQEVLQSLIVLVNIWIAAYVLGYKFLSSWIACRAMNISLQHGLSAPAPFIFCNYGALAGSAMGNYQDGFEFSKLGTILVDQLDGARGLKSKSFVLHGCFNQFWIEPLADSVPTLVTAYHAGVELGDLLYANYAVLFIIKHPFIDGGNLRDVYENGKPYVAQVQRSGDWLVHKLVLMLLGSMLCLQGKTEGRLSMSYEGFDEDEYVKELDELGYMLWRMWHVNCKVMIAFLNEDIDLAFEMVKLGQGTKPGGDAFIRTVLFSHFQVVEYYFFAALTCLARYETTQSEEEKAMCVEVYEEAEKAFQDWMGAARKVPFKGRYLLMQAERERVLGDPNKAADLYDEAIEAGRETNLVQVEALANMLAFKYYLARKKDRIAAAYLHDARYLYERWGAYALVQMLDERYPNYVGRFGRGSQSSLMGMSATMTVTSAFSTSSTGSGSTTGGATLLDMGAVFKVSQMLSSEIVLDNLLNRLMRVVIETAGASRGVLLLEKDGRLFLEASQIAGRDQSVRLTRVPLDEAQDLSHNVINYVFRTHEYVLLGENPELDEQFASDVYFAKHKPASLLVLPLMYQAKFRGILYLENDIASGAFTLQRLEILNLLSSQIAISLENAFLYENLEQQIRERTQQLIESEKMASLGSLVAGVAHEINTPLGIGITAASSLQDATKHAIQDFGEEDDVDADDVKDYLDFAEESGGLIVSNLQRAAELVQSFKQVAGDQHNQEKRHFEIKPYLEEILVSLKPQLRSYKLNLAVEGDNVEMESFPGAFFQIFTSFIMNSLQHAYSEGDDGQIRISIQQTGPDMIRIEYIDDGRGIPEDNLARIFDPFFTTDRTGGGMGLGLHIVYNLVTQVLKGRIQVESPGGRGAKFTLTVPVQSVPAASDVSPMAAPQG